MATKTYWFKADHTDTTTGLTWRAGVTDRVTDSALQTRLEAATGGAGEKVVIDMGANFVLATAIGTAAAEDIGTSGATVPLLNGANIFSATQVIDAGYGIANLANRNVPVVLPPAAQIGFPNFSGLILVNNYSTGSLSLYIVGGGGVATLGSTLGSTGGTMTFGSGQYLFTNTSGVDTSFGFFAIRTRSAA